MSYFRTLAAMILAGRLERIRSNASSPDTGQGLSAMSWCAILVTRGCAKRQRYGKRRSLTPWPQELGQAKGR